MKHIKLFEQFLENINETAFSGVLQYFKKETPNTKISIKKAPKKAQTARFGGIVYDVKVDDYKTTYTAYDNSSQEENILLRTIGNIIDNYSTFINESKKTDKVLKLLQDHNKKHNNIKIIKEWPYGEEGYIINFIGDKFPESFIIPIGLKKEIFDAADSNSPYFVTLDK